MSIDLRCTHGRRLRGLAADMFAEGRGPPSARFSECISDALFSP